MGLFSPNAKQNVFLPKLGHLLQFPLGSDGNLGTAPLIASPFLLVIRGILILDRQTL